MSLRIPVVAGPLSLAQRLRGGTVGAFWSTVPSQSQIEAIVRAGYGAVVLDAQHGLHDFASLERLVPSIGAFGGSALVRLPLGEIGFGARALDIGCAGVIAPMINTPDEARALVAALKYPPLGGRSWGPQRGLAYSGMDGSDYLRKANQITVVFAMIETETALRNVEIIAGIDGIDGLFVGPNDLSASLSRGHGIDPAHPLVVQAVEKVRLQCVRHGKIAGIYANTPDLARDYAARGYRLVAMGNEISFAATAAGAALRAAGLSMGATPTVEPGRPPEA